MSELKTRKTDASVDAFLNSVENERRRSDSFVVRDMMMRITGEDPAMWGPSLVGFGNYDYQNTTGKPASWFVTGFSPRKQALTVYIMPGFSNYETLLSKLGKHKTGRSCLYINKLDDVDLDVLEDLISQSVEWMRKKYDG